MVIRARGLTAMVVGLILPGAPLAANVQYIRCESRMGVDTKSAAAKPMGASMGICDSRA